MDDDQGAVRIEQAGVVWFQRSAGDGWTEPHMLFSLGKDCIAFSNRTGRSQ